MYFSLFHYCFENQYSNQNPTIFWYNLECIKNKKIAFIQTLVKIIIIFIVIENYLRFIYKILKFFIFICSSIIFFFFLIGYKVYIYKTLIWPTWATTTGSHFQHTPNSNTAQDRSIRCLLRVIAISGPFWGLAHMINDHDHHTDGAYRHCYHQGHFPSDPCRVILTRRHFSQ